MTRPPEMRTPGGSGQASAESTKANSQIFVDIDDARKSDFEIKSAVIANAALAGLPAAISSS